MSWAVSSTFEQAGPTGRPTRCPSSAPDSLVIANVATQTIEWQSLEHLSSPIPFAIGDLDTPITKASSTASLADVGLPHLGVVLGQLADGVDPASIEVGQEMQLVLGTLYEDDENEYVVWKWKPVDQ